jgi:hypothetical protein
MPAPESSLRANPAYRFEMRLRPAGLLLVAITGCGRPSSPPADIGEEDYRVYQAALDGLVESGRTAQLTVFDQTVDLPALDARLRYSLTLPGLQGSTRGLRRSFQKSNRTRSRLDPDRLRASVPVRLIRDGAFGSGASEWRRFFRRHPSSPGMITLSRVAFDRDSTRAVVSVDVFCPMCGHGETLLLRRRDRVWRVEDSVHRWVN